MKTIKELFEEWVARGGIHTLEAEQGFAAGLEAASKRFSAPPSEPEVPSTLAPRTKANLALHHWAAQHEARSTCGHFNSIPHFDWETGIVTSLRCPDCGSFIEFEDLFEED